MIKVEDLSYSIDSKPIIKDIAFTLSPNSFTGVVGPNGSGKSTLLKNIYRTLKGRGKIYIKDRELKAFSARELAREIAVVSQHSGTDFDFTVEDLVTMGRYPYKGFMREYDSEDRSRVDEVLSHMGLLPLRKRGFSNLSGGEQQRALIARALVQEADIIILDEPTNHLDITYQLQIMEILKKLNVTVVAAIHDMNIAALYCDSIVALKDGLIHSMGTTDEVFTEDFFREVFSLQVNLVKNPVTAKNSIIYLGAHA